ncbi:MAG TPA: protein kinase, partial [Bryobacteraceae bacterium]|nr:protein kinase [Bryobacteraceae bacterium]
GPNYLVMEYVEGTPLSGPSAVEVVLPYALQICDALAAAHDKGITHRDLKPANILLAASGIKLLDFGLAKVKVPGESDQTATHTQTGTILGTPSYMSPEQAQGQSVDARSDIFSFGSLLYEWLTGRRAFEGTSALSTLASILRDEPAPLESAPEIQRVIARCLRKHPADRYQSVTELRAALEDATYHHAHTYPEHVPSIAVLPFANLSADKENEYFSDGLADEILNTLTRLRGLRVTGRVSSFSFRGRENAITEIGHRLRVANVLSGSVQRSGNRIRVSAQLINVTDESQVWSQHYDREMRDLFDVQDEIAQAIVAQLKVRLGSKSSQPLIKHYTGNPKAHSLYLKGNFHYYKLTPGEMDKGRKLLEQAVELDPSHAPAWFSLADAYIAGAHFGGVSPRQQWPKARAAAARALEADPESAEAKAAVGFVTAVSEFRWDEGLGELDAALRLNPASARALFWRADVLHCMGRAEEAYADACRAAELDPLFTLYRRYCAYYCLLMGQPERAVEHVHQLLEIDPNYIVGAYLLGEAYSLLGRHEEGIALLEKEQRDGPGAFLPLGFLAWAYVRGGRRADAERFLTKLRVAARYRYVPPATIAMAALAVDDAETALLAMEEGVRERDPNLSFGIRTHYFHRLRADARYHDILERMNLRSGLKGAPNSQSVH